MASEPAWVNEERQFISVKEAATYLGCSIWFIHGLIYKHRDFPFKRIMVRSGHERTRSMYRIPKDAFLKWAHNYENKETTA